MSQVESQNEALRHTLGVMRSEMEALQQAAATAAEAAAAMRGGAAGPTQQQQHHHQQQQGAASQSHSAALPEDVVLLKAELQVQGCLFAVMYRIRYVAYCVPLPHHLHHIH